MRAKYIVAGLLVLYGCGPPPAPPSTKIEVSGKVIDARGEVLPNAKVQLSNSSDTASVTTDSRGEFAVALAGAQEPTSIVVAREGYRTWEGEVQVDTSHNTTGTLYLVSNDEILFSTWSGEVFMLRADGAGDPLRLTQATPDIEITPSWDSSGHTIRWANPIDGTIEEAALGEEAQTVYTLGDRYDLLGSSWSDRGTFVSRWDSRTQTADIILAESPPGVLFRYEWPGQYPDVSPQVFRLFGPEPVVGSVMVFSGAVEDYLGRGETQYGLFSVFPYFIQGFFEPQYINGTQDGDIYPRWSPYREDGSLDLAFLRWGQIYLSHVTTQNVYSVPTLLYGGDINVNHVAWAPDEGELGRLVFTVNPLFAGSPLFGPGDIVLLEYNHSTGQLLRAPQVIYDASLHGAVGRAVFVDWR